MNMKDFEKIVDIKRETNPQYFALEKGEKTDESLIWELEQEIGFVLPNDYKEYVKKYGDGYFAFTILLSCDKKSEYYILGRVTKNWINEKKFLPILDFETGDYCGLNLNETQVKKNMCIFSHDDGDVYDTGLDFFQSLLKYGLNYDIRT